MKTLLALLSLAFISSLLHPYAPDPNVSQAILEIALGVATLAMSAYQLYESDRQRKEADRLAEQDQPEREIPPHMKRALKTQSYLASLTKAPGSAYEQAYAEEKAAQFFEESKNIAVSPSQAQGALEAKYAGLTESQRDREVRSANFQAQQAQNLVGVQQAYAGFEWDQFTENVMNPYYRDMAAASALRGASEANKWGAINNTIGSLTALAPSLGGGGAGKGAPPGGGNMTRPEIRSTRRDARQLNQFNRSSGITSDPLTSTGTLANPQIMNPEIFNPQSFGGRDMLSGAYSPGYYQYFTQR